MEEYTEREYALFIMAYDCPVLFQGYETDLAFDKACEIWNEFKGSEYDNPDEGLYTCLSNFFTDKYDYPI